ncbi:MAG TPA: hypothetical protein VK897_13990 [Anaerolineales bacterium]|nr:hypothetical protein [Anaerolineales bacterium]
MVNEATKRARPSSITLISIFELYGAFNAFYYILRLGVQELGMESTILFAVGGIVSLICGIGFWFMKKWAVYTFAAYSVINQIVLLALGRWNILSFLILAIIVYIGYRNLSKMA